MHVTRHSDPDAFLAAAAPIPTSKAICARIGFRAESGDWHFDFIPPAS